MPLKQNGQVYMILLYKKPKLKSYSAEGILEKLGPCQNQYNTVTLNTTTGDSGVNIDGTIAYREGTGVVAIDTDTALTIGDSYSNAQNYLERAYVGFDISGIPSNSTIVSATLRIYQGYINGTPYTDLGNMVVDHFNFGSSLDNNDWDSGTITSNIGTISNNATLEWKELDVKTAVEADLNASRTSSQYRLRFSPNETAADNKRDDSFCECAEDFFGAGNIPELVVTY